MTFRTPPPDWSARLDRALTEAVAFFRKRSPVVFVSNQRFWEHGFVQQSLAYALANAGVEVIWVDGAGWRKFKPVIPNRPASLRVVTSFQLPLRRFPVVNRVSLELQLQGFKRALGRGKSPFFWVWGGLDEALAERLPAADVYSVFDSPYENLPDGPLCRKAKLLVCQNQFAENLFAMRHKEKVHRLLPPVEVPRAIHDKPELPAGFPKQVLGYVGAFLGDGFDFSFLEETLIHFRDWGVLLVGRSVPSSEEKVKKLSRYPNFHRVGWLPRDKALAYWNAIDVAFLPYAESMGQDGAFAVKALEALSFGKPVLATEVPKTQDLAGLVHFTETVGELRDRLEKWQSIQPPSDDEYWKLAWEMSPQHHLAQIARWLG